MGYLFFGLKEFFLHLKFFFLAGVNGLFGFKGFFGWPFRGRRRCPPRRRKTARARSARARKPFLAWSSCLAKTALMRGSLGPASPKRARKRPVLPETAGAVFPRGFPRGAVSGPESSSGRALPLIRHPGVFFVRGAGPDILAAHPAGGGNRALGYQESRAFRAWFFFRPRLTVQRRSPFFGMGSAFFGFSFLFCYGVSVIAFLGTGGYCFGKNFFYSTRCMAAFPSGACLRA